MSSTKTKNNRFKDFLDLIHNGNGDFKGLKKLDNKSQEEKHKLFTHFEKYITEIREFKLISEKRIQEGKLFNHKFFQFPKALLFKEPYCHLSNDAKLTYMLLLDQINRSRKNGCFGKWRDEKAPFVKYRNELLRSDLGIRDPKKMVQILQDLEIIGLIRRVPTTRSDMIFVGEIYLDEK